MKLHSCEWLAPELAAQLDPEGRVGLYVEALGAFAWLPGRPGFSIGHGLEMGLEMILQVLKRDPAIWN